MAPAPPNEGFFSKFRRKGEAAACIHIVLWDASAALMMISMRPAPAWMDVAFSINTFGEIMDTSGGTMKRTLRGWQLLLLGVGTMVGAGVCAMMTRHLFMLGGTGCAHRLHAAGHALAHGDMVGAGVYVL